MRLTPNEMREAEELARARITNNRRAGVVDMSPVVRPGGKAPDYCGAYGERAAHLWLHVPWYPDAVRPTDDADVGGWYEIKTRPASTRFTPEMQQSTNLNARRLAHKLGRPFILVLWHAPDEFEFVGWAWGHELLRSENIIDYRSARPYFALPQVGLHPMETLPPLSAKPTEVRTFNEALL